MRFFRLYIIENNICISKTFYDSHYYYKIDGENRYEKCPKISNCEKCNSATECISCQQGYDFVKDNNTDVFICTNIIKKFYYEIIEG